MEVDEIAAAVASLSRLRCGLIFRSNSPRQRRLHQSGVAAARQEVAASVSR